MGLLLVIVWFGAGIRRSEGEGRVSILDSPLGLITPHLVDPGWHLVPPGLLRLSSYPITSKTVPFTAGASDPDLLTREGLEVTADGALQYRVDPHRVLEVHRTLGPDIERDAIERWVGELLRTAVARSAYNDISGARSDSLRREVGRSLTEQFRSAGLVLLSFEIAAIRIRADAPEAGGRRVGGMKVLLIGLDGAEWNILDPLIESGKLPNLGRLAREGVRGRLRTITPMLSPVIWTSVATGVLPGRHGIVDFVATAGQGGERVPVTSTLRKVKAIWNILSESGVKVGVVGWWASYPAEPVDGFVVSDRVAHQLFDAHRTRERSAEGKVFPPEIEEQVNDLVVDPQSIDRERIKQFVRLSPDLPAPRPEEVQRLESLKTVLASGDTYTAASLELSSRFDVEFQAVYLEGTDTVAHLFMPYAPPAHPGVDAEARRRFGETVDRYYRHADAIIGRLLEAFDPVAVIICSDHGFRTDENRPASSSLIGEGAAADWHRKYGVIILHGAPFRKGEELKEASVLDVTPTVLTLYGLPIAEDMDGRPLVGAFEPEFLKTYPISYLDSYEGAVVAAGEELPLPERLARRQEPAPEPTPSEDDQAVLEKLRSLGYLRQDTPNSHNNRGLMLLSQGRPDEAIGEFKSAIRASEDLGMARLNLARAYLQKKDLINASQVLTEHLSKEPGSPEAENLLGNIAMERRDMEKAEGHLKRALELDPNHTDARNSLGLLYNRLGRSEEAIREFRRVVEIDADYAEAYNNIGVIHKKEGRIEEAIATFKRAIAADPDFAGSFSNLALALEERGELEQAERYFKDALRREPTNASVRANYGALLYRLGRLDEAREELETAVRADPGNASAHNNLGAVYGRIGRPDDEIASYRRAVALDPNYTDARHNLGLSLINRGQTKMGEDELRRTLEIDSRFVPAYLNLGRLMLAQGRSGEATALLSQAATELPENADIQILFGESLVNSDRREDAVRAFEAAFSIRPDESIRSRIDALRQLQPAEEEPGTPPEETP